MMVQWIFQNKKIKMETNIQKKFRYWYETLEEKEKIIWTSNFSWKTILQIITFKIKNRI